MTEANENSGGAGSQFFTGVGPAVTLWVLVVLALGYGVFKTVDTALALFTG